MATKKTTPETKPSKAFEITANLRMTVGKTITAGSLEEALDFAKTWNVNDFVDIEYGSKGVTSIQSEEPEIVGVYQH